MTPDGKPIVPPPDKSFIQKVHAQQCQPIVLFIYKLLFPVLDLHSASLYHLAYDDFATDDISEITDMLKPF